MPDRYLPALKSLAWLLGTAVTFALGYADLRHTDTQKADKAEVRAVMDSVSHLNRDLDEIRQSQQRTEQMVQKLVCRQYPNDMGC